MASSVGASRTASVYDDGEDSQGRKCLTLFLYVYNAFLLVSRLKTIDIVGRSFEHFTTVRKLLLKYHSGNNES